MNKINNFLIAIFIACFLIIAGCNQPGSSDNPTPPGSGIGPTAVNLGTAANFAILTKVGISTTLVPPASASVIVGNIGVSPIDYTAITGFNLSPAVPDVDTVSATSPLVTGTVYAADYTGNSGSTPTMLTAAIGDMSTAYLDAVGRTSIVANTNLGAGNIGGLSFAPGLYTWTTGVLMGTSITLTGGVNDRWIFQIAGTLTMSPGVSVSLSGGAQAQNIVWQATDTVAIDTTATLNGIVLTAPAKSITLNAGATVNGRLLAGGEVTLISNTVTQP